MLVATEEAARWKISKDGMQNALPSQKSGKTHNTERPSFALCQLPGMNDVCNLNHCLVKGSLGVINCWSGLVVDELLWTRTLVE